MKRIYLSTLVLLTTILFALNTGSYAQVTALSYTGSVQPYTVPAGIYAISMEVVGAQGGNFTCIGQYGGFGGRVIATMTVTPGQVLYCYVGQQAANSSCGTGSAGGSNSGGGAQGGTGSNGCGGSGGGGATDIRTVSGSTTAALNSRLIVGGGGSGAGYDCGEHGANAGGSTGSNGVDACGSGYGYGGTQSAGGSAGGGAATAGGQGYGGYGGTYYGSGGGGGYFGGGGAYAGSGGGGSSYPVASSGALTLISNTGGYNGANNTATHNGYINIWPLCVGAPNTGTASTCAGFTTQLFNVNAGGTWSSSNTGVATVNVSTGVVTGVAAGTCNIIYTVNPGCGIVTSSTAITVTSPPAAITGASSVCASQSVTLTSSVGGTSWSSSNTAIATVSTASSSTGTVTGVAAGTVIITYSVSATCYVTYPFTVLGTSPITGTPSVCLGLTTSLGSLTAGGTWSSSNTALGTVDASGNVRGISTGGLTISYTQPNGCIMPLAVTVNPLPAAITGNAAICQGLTSTLSDAGGVWSSGNTAIATITAGGVVTAVAPGSAIITYTLPTTCIATQAVTVNPLPAAITPGQVCVGLTTTLTDATPGGTWTSGTTSTATIGSTTGILTGVAAGVSSSTVPITYTLSATGCIATVTYTVNPLPLPITGSATPICAGTSIYLSDLVGGGVGVYTSSNTAVATVVPLTGSLTGVATGTSIITYTLPTGCIMTTTETVLTSPTAITGTTTMCANASQLLSCTPSGGSWTSGNPYQATVNPSTGLVTGVNSGNPIISYTLGNGCSTSISTTINAAPANISGLNNVCKNSSITLGDITPGGVWSTTSSVIATITPSGVVTGVSVSNTTVTYKLTSTNCFVTLPISVNANPNVFNVTGGGHYCVGGTGNHVNLSGSQAGVTYNLYYGSTLIGGMPGTASSLDFGLLTAAGTYTVQAVNATTGCSTPMHDTAAIAIDPLPARVSLQVPGGITSFCFGGSVTMYIDSATPGIGYNLYVNGLPDGNKYGSGHIDFDAHSDSGYYYVLATNASSGCSIAMFNPQNIVVNPLPLAQTVTGGGSYCPYLPGVHVGLDFSVPGINYQLINSAGSVGAPVPGASSPLDFGLLPQGSYSVTATNTVTGCTSGMNSSADIVTYTIPVAYAISGGGPYCSGGAGSAIQLATSDIGMKYQVYNGTAPVGGLIDGDGSVPFSLGVYNHPGTYSVRAYDPSDGCYAIMTGAVNISVNTLPTAYTVTGGGAYCQGDTGVHISMLNTDTTVSYQVYSAGLPVGLPVNGSGGPLDLGLQTAAGVYTVYGIDNYTGCTSLMNSNATVTINSLPATYNVTGGGAYCAGDHGVHVGLYYSSVGIAYQLYNGSSAIGSPMIGSNSELDFGLQTGSGTYTVIGRNIDNGCAKNMTASASVVINPRPSLYTTTGSRSSYCIGDSGIHITLNGSDAGISYQLYNGSTLVGTPISGAGMTIDFGLMTIPGTYTIVGSDIVSNCTANMTGAPVVRINPLPAVYNVTGGGSFCSGGAGVHVGLSNSASGISYQLYNGVTPVPGAVLNGTGGALDFGLQTVNGTYTAIATNGSTTCVNNMSGAQTVVVNPVPTAYNVVGGGEYCVGSAGLPIGLNNSTSGIDYKLYRGTSLISTLAGSTGSALDFGIQTVDGAYTVKAVDIVTGCNASMSGTRSILANAVPQVWTMYGGGSYCAGTSGVHVNLSGSTRGINYQLYYMGSPIGSALVATGAALDFGSHSDVGSYSVIATNPTTTCSSTMAGTSVISINPVPAVYSVTGGGSYCAGGAGVNVGISNSDIGLNYQLYKDGIAVGTAVAGSNLALNFGAQSSTGLYTVVGNNPTTGCHSSMAGSTNVSIAPIVVPSVSISTGSTSVVCGGNVVNFSADATNGGSTPTYSWKVNGTAIATGNTYSYAPANGDVVTATLTSNATCAVPNVASATMVMNVIPFETPAVTVAATPGNKICAGTNATFTATPMFGGSMPTYSWLVNSVQVGSGLSYSYKPNDGDVVIFMLNSNYPCATSNSVFSNTELMHVDMPATPSIYLNVNTGTDIAAGQVATLRAVVANAGQAPTFQWYLNNSSIPGATRQVYVADNIVNGDSITCVVTADNVCGAVSAFNSAVFNVIAEGVQPVSTNGTKLSIVPNPSNGTFTVSGTLASNLDENVVMEITNLLGQVVFTNTIKANNGVVNEKVNLSSNITNGMYLVNLKSQSGSTQINLVIEQ